jgi:D-xylose transport system permease protein
MSATRAMKITLAPSRSRKRFSIAEWVPLLALLVCALVFEYWSDGSFLTSRNLSNLSRQVCVNLTLSVGMTVVILTSGIDLSVGSVLAMSGMVAAISQLHWGAANAGMFGAFFSIGLSILVGGACGATSGFAISRLRITPFIVTLGMMVICRGLTLIISGAQAVAPIGDSFGALSASYLPPGPSFAVLATLAALIVGGQFLAVRRKRTRPVRAFKRAAAGAVGCAFAAHAFCGYRGIPTMVFLAAGCALAIWVLLGYTRFGRFVYAIGDNREAAELSGVPVQRTLWIVYILMGAFAGFAGALDVARVNAAVPSAGELGELDAIAAVVIGGTSLMGGSGGVPGTLLGVLLMGVLNNGMSLVGITEHYQKVFKGLVIILAVYLDIRAKRK